MPLYVLASGPIDHNVPLINGDGQQVARLAFSLGLFFRKIQKKSKKIIQISILKIFFIIKILIKIYFFQKDLNKKLMLQLFLVQFNVIFRCFYF